MKKLIQKINEELLDSEVNVQILEAKSSKDARKIGVHLLNPNAADLFNAVNSAERDLFNVIYVHTKKTWPFSDNVKSLPSSNGRFCSECGKWEEK